MSSKHTYIHQKVIELFKLDTRNVSPKGWIQGGTCPWCNKNDKFGVKLNDVKGSSYRNHISFNCYRGSCQQRGSEFKLLNQIGKGHILQHGEFIGNKESVESRILAVEEMSPKLDVPKKHYPFGFRRRDTNEYLIGRGFVSWQFEQYCIGTTVLDPELKHYVLFSIVEDGENKGYVGRLMMSSSEQELYEAQLGRKVPKYRNEGGVDFAKLLFGLDEVTENTHTVILVEGVTDKCNIDKQLSLNKSSDVKCCATFGKKISDIQIVKLWMKGIRNVVLMYDPDAINESKTYSHTIESWDISVKVGYLSDKDPGDLNCQELQDVLSKAQTPNQFAVDKVQKRTLK